MSETIVDPKVQRAEMLAKVSICLSCLASEESLTGEDRACIAAAFGTFASNRDAVAELGARYYAEVQAVDPELRGVVTHGRYGTGTTASEPAPADDEGPDTSEHAKPGRKSKR